LKRRRHAGDTLVSEASEAVKLTVAKRPRSQGTETGVAKIVAASRQTTLAVRSGQCHENVIGAL